MQLVFLNDLLILFNYIYIYIRSVICDTELEKKNQKIMLLHRNANQYISGLQYRLLIYNYFHFTFVCSIYLREWHMCVKMLLIVSKEKDDKVRIIEPTGMV